MLGDQASGAGIPHGSTLHDSDGPSIAGMVGSDERYECEAHAVESTVTRLHLPHRISHGKQER